MTGWWTALLVARREARRARGRSILVLAMISLPVAGLAFAAVNDATFTLSPDERAERLMGTAQAVVTWPHDGAVWQDPADLEAWGPPARCRHPPRRPSLRPRRPRATCWPSCPPGPGSSPTRRSA